MLIDHRTYTVRPGKLNAQLKLYEQYGYEVQKKYLGAPLAFLITETGELNSYVHIWGYESAQDREDKRAALNADPRWQDYLLRSATEGNLVRQRTKLMVPAQFAPVPHANE
jgi:hypothetical protein